MRLRLPKLYKQIHNVHDVLSAVSIVYDALNISPTNRSHNVVLMYIGSMVRKYTSVSFFIGGGGGGGG